MSLRSEIIACDRCPRLREHCAEVARIKRRMYREEQYWGRPIPMFGNLSSTTESSKATTAPHASLTKIHHGWGRHDTESVWRPVTGLIGRQQGEASRTVVPAGAEAAPNKLKNFSRCSILRPWNDIYGCWRW